ncbi:nucleotidyltransferase domain-containing protein [Candidatus Woesearchaeota archaeon]|nr:nucleotidyltransferase domain-containing protein [Candidatus Woesearchaeota archaeon]
MEQMKFIRCTEFFLENPYEPVYLRELARKLRISPFAARKYAGLLLKKGLITEEKKANLRYFRANNNSLLFRHLKISKNIGQIAGSGLIEYLKDNLANLSSIVLFGSMAKGSDDDRSDMDLVAIAKEKALDLRKFREKLDKEINLHVFSWAEWNRKAKEDSPFYFELISSGIALSGELPIIKWK